MNSEPCPLLVVALAGRVGSGVSFVRDKIIQELKTYKYETEVIDVSDVFLDKFYQQYAEDPELRSLSEGSKADRTTELQRRGNYLRNKHGPDCIARFTFRDFIARDLDGEQGLTDRRAYVIDSLKNPHESEYLRQVLESAFLLVGVVADDSVRRTRLIERKNYSPEQFDRVSDIDAGEKESYEQNVTDTILGADYFFENNFNTKNEISLEAERFLRLVFKTSLDTPRRDEKGMMVAYSASLESACLSRQVGAAIFSESGDVISTGRNDVPQFGGGLYTTESPAGDKRCWVHGGKCYNDNEKIEIIESILKDITDRVEAGEQKHVIKDDVRKEIIDTVRESLKSSRVKRLLEFSRSIHAEMDAILAVARENIPGLKGSTLYCTTYPCHNCAKHIVGAGIKRVVFLEPYEKSMARKLHTDSIAGRDQDRSSKRLFIDSFTGTNPKRFNDFFSAHIERKTEKGIFRDNDRMRFTLTPVGAISITEMTARLELFRREHQPVLQEEEDAEQP